MAQPVFVTLEGPRGAGKTTIAKRLRNDFCNQKGLLDFKSFTSTREIGGTAMGDHIRELFVDFTESDMDGITELLLINAARRHHLNHVVLPCLNKEGNLILCDRYILSTYAFQCGWRGVSPKTVKYMHERWCDGVMPHLCIYLDVPPDVSIERSVKRGSLIPKESIPYLRQSLGKVHNAYLKFIALGSYAVNDSYCLDNIYMVDATQSEDDVYKDVIEVFRENNMIGTPRKKSGMGDS